MMKSEMSLGLARASKLLASEVLEDPVFYALWQQSGKVSLKKLLIHKPFCLITKEGTGK